jgi:predicted ATPase
MFRDTIEQALLERLSVFAGGFTPEMAQVVYADKTIRTDEIPRLLSRLVGSSLVALELPEPARRYRVPEELRSAAYARLAARGHARPVYLRLVDYLFELATQGLGRIQEGGKGFMVGNGALPLAPKAPPGSTAKSKSWATCGRPCSG